MPDTSDNTRPGPNRRTILKASAWSVPVVAVALATPLAAASTGEFDIVVAALPDGGEIGATSPDGSQVYTLRIPETFDVSVSGAAPLPPGSTIEVRFDTRLLGDLTLNTEPGPALLVFSDIVGNQQTVRYELPFELLTVRLRPVFGIVNDGVWVPDAGPYSVVVMAPTSDEADISNNIASLNPIYLPAP